MSENTQYVRHTGGYVCKVGHQCRDASTSTPVVVFDPKDFPTPQQLRANALTATNRDLPVTSSQLRRFADLIEQATTPRVPPMPEPTGDNFVMDKYGDIWWKSDAPEATKWVCLTHTNRLARSWKELLHEFAPLAVYRPEATP